MAVVSVIEIAVTSPGDRADAILACLGERVGDLDPVGQDVFEITVTGTDIKIAAALERVEKALGDCDPEWRDFIAVAAPPGPG